jgi:hypothetical protein
VSRGGVLESSAAIARRAAVARDGERIAAQSYPQPWMRTWRRASLRMLPWPMRGRPSRHSPETLRSLCLLLACTSASVGPAGVDADAGAPAPISQAEWAALTAPRTGVHEVWSEACNGVRVEQ